MVVALQPANHDNGDDIIFLACFSWILGGPDFHGKAEGALLAPLLLLLLLLLPGRRGRVVFISISAGGGNRMHTSCLFPPVRPAPHVAVREPEAAGPCPVPRPRDEVERRHRLADGPSEPLRTTTAATVDRLLLHGPRSDRGLRRRGQELLPARRLAAPASRRTGPPGAEAPADGPAARPAALDEGGDGVVRHAAAAPEVGDQHVEARLLAQHRRVPLDPLPQHQGLVDEAPDEPDLAPVRVHHLDGRARARAARGPRLLPRQVRELGRRRVEGRVGHDEVDTVQTELVERDEGIRRGGVPGPDDADPRLHAVDRGVPARVRQRPGVDVGRDEGPGRPLGAAEERVDEAGAGADVEPDDAAAGLVGAAVRGRRGVEQVLEPEDVVVAVRYRGAEPVRGQVHAQPEVELQERLGELHDRRRVREVEGRAMSQHRFELRVALSEEAKVGLFCVERLEIIIVSGH